MINKMKKPASREGALGLSFRELVDFADDSGNEELVKETTR